LALPKTSLYGSILLGAIMTGAVCMHLSLGFPGTEMPIMLGCLGFAGYKLREV
jgi:hypothetical protein